MNLREKVRRTAELHLEAVALGEYITQLSNELKQAQEQLKTTEEIKGKLGAEVYRCWTTGLLAHNMIYLVLNNKSYVYTVITANKFGLEYVTPLLEVPEES